MFSKTFQKTAFVVGKPPTPRVTPMAGLHAKQTFPKPVNVFGTTARKGLVSRTSAVRGVKI